MIRKNLRGVDTARFGSSIESCRNTFSHCASQRSFLPIPNNHVPGNERLTVLDKYAVAARVLAWRRIPRNNARSKTGKSTNKRLLGSEKGLALYLGKEPTRLVLMRKVRQ
jgi:hypothetical protein